jgi:hypothetical protein
VALTFYHGGKANLEVGDLALRGFREAASFPVGELSVEKETQKGTVA